MLNLIEKLVEFLSMTKIALSPIALFSILGIASYYTLEKPNGIILGSCLVIIGLIIGVWIAIRIHKKHGATEFNTRVNAFPDIDKKE